MKLEVLTEEEIQKKPGNANNKGILWKGKTGF